MSKNKTTTKSVVDMKTSELNLDILKQIGTEGAMADYRKPVTFIPSHSTKGPNQRWKSAPIEKDFNEYSQESLNEMLPKDFREQGYTVNPQTLKFNSTDKVVSVDGEKQLVTLTSVTFSPVAPSLYADNKEVIELAGKAKTPKMVSYAKTPEERVLQVLVGDFQVGQADSDGATGIVGRVLQMSAIVKEEVRRNRILKTPITSIFVATLGDLVEGIAYFYNTQTFAVTLDRREQVKVARRLFQRFLMDLAEIGIPVTVGVVPGNHGENRNMGGAFTTINDNDDVALVEQIQEAFDMNPEKFGHISFLFPEAERLSLTVEILGHSIGLVHGHQVGSPKNLGAALRNYLNGQSRAKEAIGLCDYIYMGHFHHFYSERISEQTTAVMNGAMCKDSDHFKQRYGLSSPPCFVTGVLTRSGDEGFRPYYLK